MMWKRLGGAALTAVIISAVVTGTAWAAFAYSSYTGPTIIQVNNDGTWNVQWTIVVTTLSQPDKTVCVSVTPAEVSPSICGTTTGTLTCTLNNVPNTTQLGWDISSFTANNGCTGNKTLGPSGTISPLAVTLTAFSADAVADNVTLAWETVSETDNAGFNIYRAENDAGPWARLNVALIPAAAPGSSQGHAYAWTDATAEAGVAYWYQLEDVALDGTTSRHAPVTVGAAAEPNAVGLASFGATVLPRMPRNERTLPLVGLAALAVAGFAAAGMRSRRRG